MWRLLLTLVFHLPTCIHPYAGLHNGHLWFFGASEISKKRDGWFSQVRIEVSERDIVVYAYRNQYQDFQVIDFRLRQSPYSADVEYTVRTPVNRPDVRYLCYEENLSLLLIRHPDIKPMFASCLAQLDMGPYSFSKVIEAQVHPDRFITSPELKAKVNKIIIRLNSGLSRDRLEAYDKLVDCGEPAAIYLVNLPRWDLTSEQNRAIDEFLVQYAVLPKEDIELCRKDESRLKMPNVEVGGDAEDGAGEEP